MSQRAFFLVIVTESSQACDWLGGLVPQARSGPLVASADPSASLAHGVFFDALFASRRVVCAVGNEWLGALPRRFRGLFVGGNARGLSPKVLPRVHAARVRSMLAGLGKLETRNQKRETCVAPGLRRLSVAQQLVLCEPWDVFTLWLLLPEADLPQAGQKLSEIFSLLTPDIAVCGVLLSGAQQCHWFCRVQGGSGGPLPPRPVEDVLPTLLTVLGISVPPALPGTPLDLEKAVASPGYTPEDERAIQKRLEDLGYL
jgi:hypothetical protein